MECKSLDDLPSKFTGSAVLLDPKGTSIGWYYFLSGKIHGSPAIIYKDGSKFHYKHGLCHKNHKDEPAIEWADGSKEWLEEGFWHRLNGPARIYREFEGIMIIEWWINGRLHRKDGPAIEQSNGHKEWWIEGQRHREDGPAVIAFDGSKHWYQNDQLHRLNGPAIEPPNNLPGFYFIRGVHQTNCY